MVMFRDTVWSGGFMASHLAMNPSTGQYGNVAQTFLSLLLAGAAAQRVERGAADGKSGNCPVGARERGGGLQDSFSEIIRSS
jgi:hypothetical protein